MKPKLDNPFEAFSSNPSEGYYIFRELQQAFPQLNEQTRIEYVQRGQRTMLLEEMTAPLPRWYPVYVPKPGLLPMLNRWRARIHKWLVDNYYHPASRPANWKPYDISRIGVMDVAGRMPVPQTTYRRELEFKMYAYRSPEPWRGDGYTSLRVAYDSTRDTLYIQR